MAQSGTNEETKQEKKREWADVDEGLKFVNEKGKVMCKYCSKPEAGLKVTSNDISLQDIAYMTNADKDGKVNFLFEGTCNHPSQQKPFSPPPPCKAVINLGEWKNYTEVHINNDYALMVDSTIPCMISGEDLIITHSGQMAEVTELDPLPKKITDAYWMDGSSNKKHRIEYPDYPVTLFLRTRGYKIDETATVKIKSKEGNTFEGGQTELTISGKVNENKLVIIEDFKITYKKED